MKLTSLQTDHYGVLKDFRMEHLSPGLTVFHGGNGCGKSTAVNLLRELLFGFSAATAGNRSADRCHGRLSYATDDGDVVIERDCERGRTSDRTSVCVNGTMARRSATADLPQWVTQEVYDSVFTVGSREVERFDVLTELCLNSALTGSTDELQRLERAVSACRRERDGDFQQAGLDKQIADQQQQIAALRGQLRQSCLRAQPPQSRIDEASRRIEDLARRIREIDDRLASVEPEIERLESARRTPQTTGPVAMDRASIESQIDAVRQRLQRWDEVRELLTAEREAVIHAAPQSGNSSSQQSQPPLPDALPMLRALTTRLEDRTLDLHTLMQLASHSTDRDRELLHVDQLREEVAAACRLLNQEQATAAQQRRRQERTLLQQVEFCAADIHRVLTDRLSALEARLRVAGDVVAAAKRGPAGESCRHAIHRADSTRPGDVSRALGDADSEERLRSLASERTQLVARRGECEEDLQVARALRESLTRESARTRELAGIDSLQASLAELEDRVDAARRRRARLDTLEADLLQTIRRVRRETGDCVLDMAGRFVARLTDGQCQAILPADDHTHLVVRTSTGDQPVAIEQLSQGTRHQVALALRLALIRERRRTDGHVPLVLDDVFITSDDQRAEAVVELLNDLAAEGQQILFLTCQHDVCDLFRRWDADVRSFGRWSASEPVSIPVASPAASPVASDSAPILTAAPAALPDVAMAAVDDEPELVDEGDSEAGNSVEEPPAEEHAAAGGVAHADDGRSIAAETADSSPESAAASAGAARTPGTSNWLFYLECDHAVSELAHLSAIEREALSSAGVHTIGELLDGRLTDLDRRIREGGFLLTADRIREIRGQATLSCCVPMLQPADAALLVACGIADPDELGDQRPDALFEHVVAFQRTEAGRAFRRAGYVIDQQQAINWVRGAQYRRTPEDARTTRSRFSVRQRGRLLRVRRPADTSPRVVSRDRRKTPVAEVRQHPVPRGTARRQRALHNARRRRQQRRGAQQRRARAASHRLDRRAADRTTALRFHLSHSSPIVDAPSIGPRTAERMEDVGILTVADLLSQPAVSIAEKLSRRRITTAVIRQWQAQAELMCLVPELRGHDVQILVACDICSPDDLLQYSAEELLDVVEPFARSREGQRIIRGGSPPDLREVSNWLRWARSARSLKAA